MLLSDIHRVFAWFERQGVSSREPRRFGLGAGDHRAKAEQAARKMNTSTAENAVQWLFLDLNAFFASCEQQENWANSLLEGEGFEPLVPRLKVSSPFRQAR